ncbi:Multidrug resistance-associated protein 1 [Mortierella sp. AD094]|nr:Multidrug resistance-associated protein 1 [Mortierella sp. AD094]
MSTKGSKKNVTHKTPISFSYVFEETKSFFSSVGPQDPLFELDTPLTAVGADAGSAATKPGPAPVSAATVIRRDTDDQPTDSTYDFSRIILSTAGRLGLAIHARTLYFFSTPLTNITTKMVVTSIMIALLLLGFTVEAWPRGFTKVQQESTAPIYEKANLFSQITYYFYQPIISLSVKRPLTMEDIANQLPGSNLTRNCYAGLDYFWTRALQNASAKRAAVPWRISRTGNTWTPSLFRTIVRSHLADVPLLAALRLSRVFANYAVPAILSPLLAFFQDIQRESLDASSDSNISDKTSLSYGLFLVAAMFLAGLANAILVVVSRQYCIMRGLETRSALMAMVYGKSLRLSPGARQKSTTGTIMNHMSVDADIWGEGGIFLTMWISIPAEIAVGWSVWVGMFTIVALSPLQAWRAKVFRKLQREKWSHMDERIRLTTESLSAIKVVKLYAWESPFLQKILAVRDLELGVLRRMGMVSAVMSIVFSSSTLIICLTTLSVFATWGGPDFTPGKLTPQVVFVSMTLFAMLKTPISNLTDATTSTISLLVSTKRIESFLLEEEIDKGAIDHENDVLRAEPGEPLVLIRDGSFSWTKLGSGDDSADETQGLLSMPEESVATLQHISLSVQRDALVAVVGRVGQGKSSLLSAIIGEMYKSQGYVKTIGRIAYVPQQAWILNATLRENILFGKEFDEERYHRIVYACGLEPDIEMLPAGDMTEIGERGINLSGGQKQRVSLARAAYDDADIYLLDDPLSAVDAHVDRLLWTNLIGPQGLLQGKARLLVTHGIHHLHEVDRVVLLKNGQIVEDGNYDELMGAKQTFYQLIKEYSVTHKTQENEVVAVEDVLESIANDSRPDKNCGETQGSESTGSTLVAGKSKAEKKDTNGKLITVEKIDIGELRKSVVLTYLCASSYKNVALVVALHILAQVSMVGTNLWLKYWITSSEQANREDKENPLSLNKFLFVFAMLTLAHVVVCIFLYWISFAVASIRASKHLHQDMMTRIMRLPSAFFDTTPVGRIINRVSSDMASIDDRVAWKLFETTRKAISVIAALTIVAFTAPVFLFASPFMFFAYHVIQNYYLHASRSCKRAFQITKSPIFQHFQETLGGVSTIRAMGLQDRFIQDNATKSDCHSNAFVAFGFAIRWVEVQTQLVSIVVVLMASLWFVLTATRTVGGAAVDAATAGLALSFAMNISDSLIWFTRSYCDLYTHLICVERVQEMSEMKTEAPIETDPNSSAGHAIQRGQWPPQQGAIEFVNYSTRYREGLDLVLRHLVFKVGGGEKIGIVGRTGAGKSSLTLALFRMIEAANSYWAKATDNSESSQVDSNKTNISSASEGDEGGDIGDENVDGGRIEIDGIDISKLGLRDLRQHLAIIPQEPVLFAGSIRENLDPFQELEDVVLWEALERSHLKAYVSSLAGGLSHQVSQNGENFSVGQRSLICLARALLRKSKILVLDEATSAVDVETDELIQQTIRTEFKDRTILTIAHRIKTVMDSDKILVLDQGRVVEYDSPKMLLQNEKSLFYRLAKQAGEI